MVVVVSGVHKSYGSFKAVNGVTFSIPASVCYGLLGPNGAGKTTLLKIIYGAALRDSSPQSRVTVFGCDPHKNALGIKFLSGVVSQDNNLDVELNVEQNLGIFARFYGISGAVKKRRIEELLEFMELSDKRKAKINELSGGMKRRLIIVRALLNNPKLLILDEPTTGLDPQVRHTIWEKLRTLKRQGMTIMLTTHYMEEAFQICDTIMIMNKGKSVMEGNPVALTNEQIEPYVLEIFRKEAYSKVAGKLSQIEARIDNSTEIVRVYTRNEAGIRTVVQELRPGDYFIRQSNLEDLFLKTTGSVLNEHQ